MFADQVVKVIIGVLKEGGSDVQIHHALIDSPLTHKIMATWCKLRVAVSSHDEVIAKTKTLSQQQSHLKRTNNINRKIGIRNLPMEAF
jgi:hypothetical protein